VEDGVVFVDAEEDSDLFVGDFAEEFILAR